MIRRTLGYLIYAVGLGLMIAILVPAACAIVLALGGALLVVVAALIIVLSVAGLAVILMVPALLVFWAADALGASFV